MKVTILVPKSEFTNQQQNGLAKLGEIVYSDSRLEYTNEELVKLCVGSEILAPDPDNLGGFEKARENLTRLMTTLPKLKGLALSTTSYGWIDFDYCKKHNISVLNIPGYSREAVAEHTFALLLCLAKRIIISDRQTRGGKYKLEMGLELKDKTLGIIGIGNIGSRVAELAHAVGMKVIAYNHSPKKYRNVEMKSLNEVLINSDAITIHTTHTKENEGFIGKNEISKLKNGVIIVNTADRTIVDEKVLATALKLKKIYGYAYEGEDLTHGPLANIENAVGIRGFGWYTKESMQRLMEIWIGNIKALVAKKPTNTVSS